MYKCGSQLNDVNVSEYKPSYMDNCGGLGVMVSLLISKGT
jgi:hypothetical protein